MKIALVGAGITGLTAAWRLSQKGHQVSLFEKEKYAGGLIHGFKQDSWNWYLEDFFHHLFTSDSFARNLISELGFSDKLFYVRPKTSIFKNGKISQFDSPLSLLKFPHLSILEKIRTGAITAYLRLTNNWQNLEKITAAEWLLKFYGQKPHQILWEPLLKSKFGPYADQISMAWFWARIKKRSSSLGYLKGGFPILIRQLAEGIKNNGGEIFLNREIKSLEELKDYHKIIITVPTEKFFKIKSPKMLGAINLIFVLKDRFLNDGTYWLNTNEENFPFVAVVEHTNFVDKKNYGGNHLVYVGGYYSQNHRYFKMAKKQIFDEFWPYLHQINPGFNQLSVISYKLSVNLSAQPIVPINYSQFIPPHQTHVPNVYLANMQQVYPWDRGMNYAIEIGEKIAKMVDND